MTDRTTILHIFLLLRSTPAWLALSRQARADYIAGAVRPLFEKHPPRSSRFFDAEAFSGRCSDILLIEVEDLRRYGFLIDALRDEAFFGLPYFQVVDVIPTLEDSYRDYDAETGVAA
ncbi:MAG: Darcynin 1 [Proteobacteria bacterium]|nr:Darcynin 1 [Pseudomonadota bacterium]